MNIIPHLNISISSEKFILEYSNEQSEQLLIDRISGSIDVRSKGNKVVQDLIETRYIYGVVGIINLLAGPYLILINKATKVGEIYGQTVWRIDETEVIPFHKRTWHLTDDQIRFNQIYLSMVKSVLNTPYFYYSLTYDITHTLQRLFNVEPGFMKLSPIERADRRFVWNYNLIKSFITNPDAIRYVTPIIHGFVSCNKVSIGGKNFNWTLVSRRNVHRAGVRLFIRGIDDDGNVANYVETEQIVEYENSRSSFVQTRGSIPLYWSQYPNLRYKPDPLLCQLYNHMDALKKHIDQCIINYGKIVIVNLINQRGPEHPLEIELNRLIEKLNNNWIRYEAFDFHHECRKMRWDKLSILVNRIEQDQSEMGYFLMSPDGSVLSLQDGVFRINCIDSLDRTNVVQGLVAKRSLEDQLRKFSILPIGDKIENHISFENTYRNVWADNADICSIEYAGTGALKTDFTRTGKRTRRGLIKDGINSMVRYYKNNFSDGFRQDSIDLFLGNYDINENEGKLVPCPLEDKKDKRKLFLPLIILGALSMFFFTIFLSTEYTTETFMYLLFWSGMIAISVSYMLYYGTEFVNVPKLCELKPKNI